MDYMDQALSSMDIVIDDKKSIYVNTNNRKVPRVTQILSKMIHNDGLMYWANSLGFKGIRYRDELNRAVDVGTEAHSCIEKYLKEKIQTDSNIPFLGFMSWVNIITQDMGLTMDLIYSEHKLVCKWFGGTLDALIDIGGKIYLIDFKTSNHVTFTYFLQLAAYIYMLRREENIYVDGVIVLQLNKKTPEFNEYLLDFSIESHNLFMNNCINTFLSLVYSYYNIYKIEEDFKDLFKGGN